MTRIAVIDHGAGNLVSIAQGLQDQGALVTVAAVPADLTGMDGIVLPGVGATGAAMDRIRAAGLAEPLTEWQGPLLGICVGLQLFFTTSEEDGGTDAWADSRVGAAIGFGPAAAAHRMERPSHAARSDLRWRSRPDRPSTSCIALRRYRKIPPP